MSICQTRVEYVIRQRDEGRLERHCFVMFAFVGVPVVSDDDYSALFSLLLLSQLNSYHWLCTLMHLIFLCFLDSGHCMSYSYQ